MKLLKFQATWCQPCKALSKSLSTVDLGVDIEEIDIEQSRDLVADYGVRSVPTLVLLKDGVELSRIVGNTTVDKIQTMISTYS